MALPGGVQERARRELAATFRQPRGEDGGEQRDGMPGVRGVAGVLKGSRDDRATTSPASSTAFDCTDVGVGSSRAGAFTRIFAVCRVVPPGLLAPLGKGPEGLLRPERARELSRVPVLDSATPFASFGTRPPAG